MLRIAVLGRLEADVDGRPVDLAAAGARARGLLGWLAVHPGPHARGALAGRLRPDVGEEGARKSLRQAAWALRGALGDDRYLVGGRDALGLAGDAALVDVDLVRMRAHAAAGDHEAALALARGPLLAGLDEEWADELRRAHRGEVARLLAAAAGAAEARGDLAAAIAWSRRLVADEPHDEIAARALIARLARAGDRAGAVAAFEALRERLGRDLGVVPSAESRELLAEVRGGRPAAPGPPEGGAQPPLPGPLAPRGGFVGRAGPLARLGAAWRDARRGALRVMLVTGEPGIGKTSLVAAFAAGVHAAGAHVLYGRCDEDLLVPHQPFVEALERHLAALPAPERDQLAGPRRGALARVLPALGAGDDAPGAGDVATGRWLAFEAVRGLIEALARRRPALLVLDDLHWADVATLRLLRHIGRTAGGARVMVAGTYRDTELGRGHPLAAALADLRREQPVVTIRLEGLGPDEAAALAGPRAGAAAELVARTGGNPLFLGELARHLAEGGGGALPEGVAEVIARRVDRLGAAAADVLTTAALAGGEVAVGLLEGVHGEAALDAVERALAAGLLVEDRGAPGHVAVAHALVAEAVAARLPAVRRRRRHLALGREIARRAGRDPAPHAADAARHFRAAQPDGDPEEVVRWSALAAARAAALLDDAEAATHLRHALDALPPGDRREAGLLADLGDALTRAGSGAAARDAFARAGALAAAAGDAPLQARAAIGAGGIGVTIAPCDEAVAAGLERALAAVGGADVCIRARLLSRLAIERYYADRRGADALSLEAVELARASRDPGALAAALNARRVAIWDIDHAAERLATADEMVAAAERAGDDEVVLQARSWRVLDLLELGRADEMREEVARHEALAGRLGLPHHRWWPHLWRGCLALMAGDPERAEAHGREALALGRRADDRNAALFVAIQRAECLIQRGELDRIDRAFVEDHAASGSPAAWAWRAWLASIDAAAGRTESARATVAAIAADDFAAVRLDANWHAAAELAEAVAAVGDAARAARLREILAPHAGLVPVVGRAALCYGPLDHHLGLLALTAGDPAAAAAHLEAAVREAERIGATRAAAMSRARLGRARAALTP
ncbi:ATP-binding protein [Miltoncostaea marina]|uniref:ATP-binding protein n=1 Tax=Miltoncostaea marina TaxID=2843215 RepID=UPI001C3DB4F3|nr:AAA family ATPase [Miltoncostaea marina]